MVLGQVTSPSFVALFGGLDRLLLDGAAWAEPTAVRYYKSVSLRVSRLSLAQRATHSLPALPPYSRCPA